MTVYPWKIMAPVFALVLTLSAYVLAAEAEELARYSAAEVAKHDGGDSCWLIIDDKVYDVSDYLYQHPGGAGVIFPYCGDDGSDGMHTKGYGSEHSEAAWRELKQYLIGELDEQ
jgi:cytochrome b involved in lipid metabolism